MKNKDIKNNMIKLFILHKNNNLFYDQLKYYNKLNQILIEVNNNNLSIQPQQNNIQIINLDEQGKSKKSEIIKSLDEFDNFLNDVPNWQHKYEYSCYGINQRMKNEF